MVEDQLAVGEAFAQPLSLSSTEFLIKTVHGANEATLLKAAEPIRDACAKELTVYCPDQFRTAVLTTRHYLEGDGVSLWTVADACRQVGFCLAKNADVLSTFCKYTIIKSLTMPLDSWTPMPTPSGTPFSPPPFTPPPGTWGQAPSSRPGEHKKWHHGGRHHRIRLLDEDSEDSNDHKTKAGVEVYVINNGGGPGGQGGHGGFIGRHHRHPHHHHGPGWAHCVVWAFVLPFFCIGVYVTVKHAITYIKKRQASLPVAVRSGGYEPLRTTESSS
ncbi:hypothetical protein Poli38472_011378 [Pythium oligandrum]|uniref:Uncharacterized protein n=1 Tax=Pythium oligandrum TaxID=41045 RepID=A0A8K1FNB9_PYTOL|nr:hypothetical protein Poli38472_011378 [Pythium oligandrum]|eukprot:TMW64498.1 hypothetical protein Poli38472_011378 [Pythium oligandrum]